jgi:hypothetical protein
MAFFVENLLNAFRVLSEDFLILGTLMPLSLLTYLKSKLFYSTFDSVSILIPTRILRDYSTFVVSHNFKVSPLS